MNDGLAPHPHPYRILWVAPETDLRDLTDLLDTTLAPGEYTLVVAPMTELTARLSGSEWELILCDLDRAGAPPAAILQAIQTLRPAGPVIFLTDAPTARATLQIMRLGARGLVDRADRELLAELVAAERQAVPPHAAQPQATKWADRRTQIQNAILQQSHDLIAMGNLSTGIVFMNQAGAAMLGAARPDQLLGKHIYDFQPPDEAVRLRREFLPQALAAGYWRGESRLQALDGRSIPVDQTIFPIYDDQGAVIQVATIAVDITARKQAELALQEANSRLEQRVAERTAELERAKDRLEAIVNHSGDGIVLVNLAGAIERGNHAFEAMLGLPSAAYLGANLAAQFTAVDGPPLADVIAAAAAAHQTLQLEAQAVRADGAVVDVEISIAPVNRSEKEVRNLVCIIRDIGERKRLQTALHERYVELERFFTVALDLHSITSREGRFIKVNQAWEEILGYPAAELEGRLYLDFVHPDDIPATIQARARLANQETVTGFVNRYRAHDGAYRFIEWRSRPFGTYSYGAARDITERIRIEEELRSSEERYRATLAAMSEGLVVQGSDGAIQFCNAAAEHILGLTAAQMNGRTSVDPRWRAVHPDGSDFPGETHPAMVTLQTGASQSNVVMGVHKPDGELTWILVNSQLIPDPKQQQTAVVTTFTDITELKRAEVQLQEKHREELQMQAYLRALHEITVELTHTESMDDFYRCVVERGREHFGFERMGLLLLDEEGYVRGTYGTDPQGNLFAEHHHRFHPDDLTGILKQTLDRSRRFVFEEEAELYADFKPIGTGQNAVAALWNGGVLGWLAADNGVRHSPITPRQLDILALYAATVGSLMARRQAERTAVELSQRLELAARAGGIGIWDWEPATDRLYWDEGMDRVYGISAPARGRLSTMWGKLIHPDDLPAVRAAVDAAIAHGTPIDTQFRILADHGDVRHVSVSASALRGDDGQVTRLVGVSLDVTNVVLAEQALRGALEKEREFGELRSRFVSMASHEFRTPLTAISATAETLLYYRERMNNTQLNDRLTRIIQQVSHMVEIMEDVLNLSRMQGGHMNFMPARGDFALLCADIVDEFAHQPIHADRIVYTGPKSALFIHFDRRLMRLVVSNLVQNALKYSPPEKPVHVRLIDAPDSVTFAVSDQGIGIPEDARKHLFEPFHRANNVGAIPGTGLGLSISKQAVDAHRGELTVTSRENEGTTFTVVLPKSNAEESPDVPNPDRRG